MHLGIARNRSGRRRRLRIAHCRFHCAAPSRDAACGAHSTSCFLFNIHATHAITLIEINSMQKSIEKNLIKNAQMKNFIFKNSRELFRDNILQLMCLLNVLSTYAGIFY